MSRLENSPIKNTKRSSLGFSSNAKIDNSSSKNGAKYACVTPVHICNFKLNVNARGNGIHSISVVHIWEAGMTNDLKHDLQALGIALTKLLHTQHGNVALSVILLGVSTPITMSFMKIKINWQ